MPAPAVPGVQDIDFASLFTKFDPTFPEKADAPDPLAEFSFAPRLPDSVPINLPAMRIIPDASVRPGNAEAAITPEAVDQLQVRENAMPAPMPEPSDSRLIQEIPLPDPAPDNDSEFSPPVPLVFTRTADIKPVLDIEESSRIVQAQQMVAPPSLPSLPDVSAPQAAVEKPAAMVPILSPSPPQVIPLQPVAASIVARDVKTTPVAPSTPMAPAAPISSSFPELPDMSARPDLRPPAPDPTPLVASSPIRPAPEIVLSPRQVHETPRVSTGPIPVVQPAPTRLQPVAPLSPPNAPESYSPPPSIAPQSDKPLQPKVSHPISPQPGQGAPADVIPVSAPMADDPQPMPIADSPHIRAASPGIFHARPVPDAPPMPRLISYPISPPDRLTAWFADESDLPGLINATPARTIGAELPVTPLPQRPDLPVHIARQLVDASRATPDRPIELSLSPAELGRVRMVMTAVDEVMTVAIVVERGETLDLMRRNIDSLAAEFRQLGYRDLSFSFSQQQQDGGGARQQGQPNTTALTPPSVAQVALPLRVDLAAGAAMDIRL